MKKTRIVVISLFVFTLFALISAQETKNKNKASGGGKVTDPSTQSPKKEQKPQTRPNYPKKAFSGFGGGGSAFKPNSMSEEEKALHDATRGTLNMKFEFMKKYPENGNKTRMIQDILSKPMNVIGFNNRYEGTFRLSPDWKTGMFNAYGGRLMFIDMETSKIFKMLNNLGGVKFSPTGSKLYNIGSVAKPDPSGYNYKFSGIGPRDFNGVIAVYDAETGKTLKIIKWNLNNAYEQPVRVEFTKDEKKLLSCSKRAVALWDYETTNKVAEFSVPAASFKIAKISDDNKYIACAGSEKTRILNKYGDPISKGCLYIWNVEKKELVYSCLEDVDSINEICFSPDGKFLASTTAENRIVVRDIKTGKYYFSFEGHKAKPAKKIVFSPDSKLMITTDGSDCRFWDIEGRKQRKVVYEIKTLDNVKFEKDAMLIADRYIRWSVSLKDNVQTLNAPVGAVITACYSSDGKVFAAGTNYGRIRIWDAQTREKLLDVNDGKTIGSLSKFLFMPDNKAIVCSTNSGDVRFFNVSDGKMINEFKAHEDYIDALDVSSDGKMIATGSKDNTVKIWNASDDKLITTLTKHTDEVTGVSFSTDGKLLATCSHDKTAIVWKTEDWSISYTDKFNNKLNGIQFIHNSDEFCVATDSKKITQRKTSGMHQYGSYYNTYDTNTREFAISLDNKYLASTNSGKKICVWDTRNRLSDPSIVNLLFENENNNSRAICISPDNKTLITGDYENEQDYSTGKQLPYGKIRLWDLTSVQQTKNYFQRRGRIYDFDISPDGKLIAYALYNYSNPALKNVEIWSLETNLCVKKLDGHKGNAIKVKFSHDGKTLASGTYGTSKNVDGVYINTTEVKLWDVESGKLLRAIESESHSVYNIEFSPDDKLIVVSGGSSQKRNDKGNIIPYGALRVWEVDTGKMRYELTDHSAKTSYSSKFVYPAKFSPDGKTFVSNSYPYYDQDKYGQWNYNGELILWNTETGEVIRKIEETGNQFTSVEYTHDSKYIITGESKTIGFDKKLNRYSKQGFIKFRSVETGEIVRTIKIDNAKSLSVQLSPDGKTLLSGVSYKYKDEKYTYSGKDLLFIDIESGKPYGGFDTYRSDSCYTNKYSPDGKYIIVHGEYVYPSLKFLEDKVGSENLYKHLFNYNTPTSQIVTCFNYSKNGFNKEYHKIFDWEAIAKNYPDKSLSEVQELISMERMKFLLWYFDMLPVGLGNEEWLTEEDGEYYATCKFKMRRHSDRNTELDEWYLTVKARLNKKEFTWQIVDMGNFPLDLMGLSKITIKYKDNKAGYWMEVDYLVTPKQREALEKKLADNPEYVPQEYYVEFYSKGSAKRLKPID